ncbi:MAG: DUF1674 domain-containing protein [Magnetospirillum sp.]|nr:DUF1674 domain-containing protein [Magnetospirillum sp.]
MSSIGSAMTDKPAKPAAAEDQPAPETTPPVKEVGGPQGPEPTRFGDWEKAGRCSDF